MSQPEIDPSVTAWKSFDNRPASNHQPTPDVNLHGEWRWGWHALIGFHYGPIPVGLLIAIPILIAIAR
jgi:hypothetical protein